MRVRFGLQGRAGVVRLIVGEGAAASVLPDVSSGTIALCVEESQAGVCYVLVMPALGAGA